MRCLVTGCAGFIGSHLSEHLLAAGHEVCGIDAFTDYYSRAFKEKNLQGSLSWNNFTFVDANLLDVMLSPLLEGVDWIFHLAAQAGVRSSWGRDFHYYVDYNVKATQRLLEAARQEKHIQRFIYASSSSVYGDVSVLPLTEELIPRPVSPYGTTKLAAEHLCWLYYYNFGLPIVALRYFTVYGPRQRPDMAFHRFCRAMLKQEPIRVYGDGQQSRDFTYISDIIDANLLAASAKGVVGEIINVGGGACTSLNEVLWLLKEISGLTGQVLFEGKQRGDVVHTSASIAKAEQLLGYRPIVSLAQGLTYEFEYMTSLYGRKTAAIA